MEKALVKYLSRYAELSAAELEAISSRMVIREVRKREMILNIGEQEDYLNLVMKGVIRKFFYKNRDEVITQIACEGDLISSSVSFLSNQPSLYAVEALESSVLASISREKVEELYEVSPRLERMGRVIITELYLEKERWEQNHIEFDIRERFVNFVHSNPDLIQRVPQKYIASYLNIKPETFSRLKHLLKKSPLIATLS